MKIENEGLSFETEICTKTLYNYISKGYFLNLTNRNLPRRGKKVKRRYQGAGNVFKRTTRNRIATA